MKENMGHSFIVEGGPEVMSDPETRLHIRELANVPAAVLSAYAKYGQVRIAMGGVPDVDNMKVLKGVVPRNWPAEKTWDHLSGCFDQGKRQVLVGVNDPKAYWHGSPSLILHEFGHGVDYVSGLSKRPEFKALHTKYLLGMDPYQAANADEFFAETFAHMYASRKTRDRWTVKYPDVIAYMKQVGVPDARA